MRPITLWHEGFELGNKRQSRPIRYNRRVMNREEALHTLGLSDDASPEDIKTAYKETAQILHPDRFAGNKKLADRATEQFKNLQAAYEFLTSGAGSRASSSGPGAGSSRTSYSRADQLNARLAGIDAARVQLVAQRDSFLDQRRTGIMLAVGGLAVAILLRRIRPLAAIAGAALIWGVVDLIASMRNLDAVNKQLEQLRKERNAILDQMSEDDGGEADWDYADDEDDFDADDDYDYDYDEEDDEYDYADEEDGDYEYIEEGADYDEEFDDEGDYDEEYEYEDDEEED